MAERERVSLECPECAADIAIERADGGERASGGYVLKCQHCGHVFSFDLAGKAGSAAVVGADLVDAYDVANKAAALKRHGVAES